MNMRKGIIFSLQLLLLDMIFAKLAYSSVDDLTTIENNVLENCSKWLAATPNSITDKHLEMALKTVPHGMCISGTIDQVSSEQFSTLFGSIGKEGDFVIVIRSSGGEVDSSMHMANLIAERAVSIIAVDYCASSCANYIFPAAKRKIVIENSILMFHGGVSLNLINNEAEQVYEIYEKNNRPNPEKGVEDIRKILNNQIESQEALLTRLGVSKHLFRWMELFNFMPETEKLRICPPGTSMTVYDPKVLKEFGYNIDVYLGPASQRDLDLVRNKLEITGNICYWTKHPI